MKNRTNKYIRAMRRSIFISALSLLCLIGSIIWFALTPKSQYIWSGWLYILLIIIFSITSIFGLFGILANYGNSYYKKNRYRKIAEKYAKLYNPQKSIIVNVNDLMYYLNIKYLGGDRVIIKFNNHFYVLERQVFPNKNTGIYNSIYSFNQKVFGARFDKLLVYEFEGSCSLSELKEVELIYHNGKYPFELNIKRNYDNCKPHPNLTLWGILLTIFGTIFCVLCYCVDDWYISLIIGAIMILFGSIFLIILSRKIREESLVE